MKCLEGCLAYIYIHMYARSVFATIIAAGIISILWSHNWGLHQCEGSLLESLHKVLKATQP